MLMNLMTIQEVLYWSTDLCDGDHKALGMNSLSSIVALETSWDVFVKTILKYCANPKAVNTFLQC